MSWARRLASRWKYPEQRVWFVVAGWAAVLTALAVVASVGYSTLILAYVGVGVTSSRTVTFTGMPAGGGLSDSGTVNLTLTLVARNPSPRSLTFASLAYKAWIEDLPMEAGLPNLGRTSVLTNRSGTRYFFNALLGSSDVTPVPIQPGATGTLTVSYVLSRASDAARFRAVQNITEYAAHVRGNGTAVPWVHWLEVLIVIRDLPAPSPSANPFLSSVTRIVRQDGDSLA